MILLIDYIYGLHFSFKLFGFSIFSWLNRWEATPLLLRNTTGGHVRLIAATAAWGQCRDRIGFHGKNGRTCENMRTSHENIVEIS